MRARRGQQDDYIRHALDNTTEAWKVALVRSAADSDSRERWILRVAVATLIVSVVALVVTLLLR